MGRFEWGAFGGFFRLLFQFWNLESFSATSPVNSATSPVNSATSPVNSGTSPIC